MVTRLIFLFLGLIATAARAEFNPLDYVMTVPIQWVCPRVPHFETNNPLERVRIDISIDGGQTWTIPVANGYPSEWGTNTLLWPLRVTPDRWTDQGRLRIQTLWSSTTNVVSVHEGDISDQNFCIAGIRIMAPATNDLVYIPSYVTVSWRETGSEWVRIGTSTDGVHFVESALLQSPPGTNSYLLALADLETGPLWVAVASAELPGLSHKVRLNAVAFD